MLHLVCYVCCMLHICHVLLPCVYVSCCVCVACCVPAADHRPADQHHFLFAIECVVVYLQVMDLPTAIVDVLRMLVDEAGFLMEGKLPSILADVPTDEQNKMRMDAVLKALGGFSYISTYLYIFTIHRSADVDRRCLPARRLTVCGSVATALPMIMLHAAPENTHTH